ncbi:hypothetical protein AVEN_225533-1, partial [Araneus ventricosus]
ETFSRFVVRRIVLRLRLAREGYSKTVLILGCRAQNCAHSYPCRAQNCAHSCHPYTTNTVRVLLVKLYSETFLQRAPSIPVKIGYS